MPETIDSALKARVRDVLNRGPATEAELRKLAEEGQACALILGGQLERSERALARLSGDPDSSLSSIATALRDVTGLRADRDELHGLLDELNRRAREFRAAWVRPA